MRSIKEYLDNYLYQIQDTINILRKTLLQILATFLIWLAIGCGIGFSILIFLFFLEKYIL